MAEAITRRAPSDDQKWRWALSVLCVLTGKAREVWSRGTYPSEGVALRALPGRVPSGYIILGYLLCGVPSEAKP